MLDELISYHQHLMSTMDTSFKRYLFDKINWQASAICVLGARGVGKTTLLCQYFLEKYKTTENALYISADNIHVTSHGLLKIASNYFALGGKALLIDEVHKYPDWTIEIKNIIDIFRDKQIIISGSSSIALHTSKADLSRRIVYYTLQGLSFREYLKVQKIISITPLSLTEVLENALGISNQFIKIPILKHFNDYLSYGYYPFFLEGIEDYRLKLSNVIEKVLTEDIAFTQHIKPQTIIVLKKFLWLIATTPCFIPNVDKISKSIGVTREIIYNTIEYLSQSGLITPIPPQGQGLKLLRKPGKIVMSNANLLHVINGSLKIQGDLGTVRETFFVNQLSLQHKITVHDATDFLIDDQFAFEIGGTSKERRKIKTDKPIFLALDGMTVGTGSNIPLFFFGLLY